MASVLNLSAYSFTPLDDLPALRDCIRAEAHARALKGTVLLSGEGINLFVAGSPEAARAFLAFLRDQPGLRELDAKESFSAAQPFGRMRVKIKREIIAFGVPGIDPARAPAPKLAPRTLKAWLDEGGPLTLLDTRNDYEIAHGTFRGAVPIGVKRFRDFPSAVQRLDPTLKARPVVMFCTGGIRCEKAGPLMQREGFEVFQLEGGILRYFEHCGGAHFEGDCFVFDERTGLDAGLRAKTDLIVTPDEPLSP